MKKILLSLLFLSVMIMPLTVLAQLPNYSAPVGTASRGVEVPTTNVENTINGLTNWFFAIFLIVAVWFLILAGFNFVTANGDSEKIKTARNNLMWAAVGILIAVLAKGIVSLAFGLARQ